MDGDRWLLSVGLVLVWPIFWLLVLFCQIPIKFLELSKRGSVALATFLGWLRGLSLSSGKLLVAEATASVLTAAFVFEVSSSGSTHANRFAWSMLFALAFWAIVFTLFLRARFKRGLFYTEHSAATPTLTEEARIIAQQITASRQNREEAILDLFALNHRVAGEALYLAFSLPRDPNPDSAPIPQCVSRIEHFSYTPRALAPVLAYLDERLSEIDTCNWLRFKAAQGSARWRPGLAIRAQLLVKRAIDIVLSFLLLLLFSPVAAAIALRTKRISGDSAPAIFTTKRFGRNGKDFSYFRLNAVGVVPSDGRKYISDSRRLVIWLGLDRIPTFVNVLAGEMSLVGPRPLYRAQLNRMVLETMQGKGITEDAARTRAAKRFVFRPGMFGQAELRTITERSDVTCSQTLDDDLDYIENWSILRDLSILVHSVIYWLWRVFTVRDVYVWPSLAAYVGSPQSLSRNLETVKRIKRGQDGIVTELWKRASQPIMDSQGKSRMALNVHVRSENSDKLNIA